MPEIVHVPFHHDTVLCVDIDGRPHVVLKAAFDAIGLDGDQQVRKVRRQPWATTVVTPVVAADGRLREAVVGDLRTFLMALAVVPTARVAEAVRPKLIEYQREVADVIEAHFTKRRHPDDDEPRTFTWDETTAVLAQRYGIEMTVSALLRLLRTAGVLKQTSAPMAKYRHWFWFTGSTWNVHPHMVKALAVKVADVRTELLGFRALQLQLELDGVGQNGIAA